MRSDSACWFALVFVAALAATGTAMAQPASPLSRPPSSRDQVATYVAEASQRFGIPAAWITAVMRVESGGDPAATSPARAMGLMQVMPETYATLRVRLGLGANPYDLRDNIMAGAAYLRELHDRYGPVGFLAAYNAGPGRWEQHLAGVRPLPPETVRYLARLAPMLDERDATALTRAVAPVALPPEAAPIFVVLGGQAMTVSSHRPAPDPVQLTAAGMPGQALLRGMFVARPPAPATHPGRDGDGTARANLAFRPDAPAADPVQAVMSSSSIFVPRPPARTGQ